MQPRQVQAGSPIRRCSQRTASRHIPATDMSSARRASRSRASTANGRFVSNKRATWTWKALRSRPSISRMAISARSRCRATCRWPAISRTSTSTSNIRGTVTRIRRRQIFRKTTMWQSTAADSRSTRSLRARWKTTARSAYAHRRLLRIFERLLAGRPGFLATARPVPHRRARRPAAYARRNRAA